MWGTRVLHCITDHFLMDTGDLCKQSQRMGLYHSHIAQLQSGPSENLHIFYLCQFYSCASLEHINWTADAFWNTIELPLNLVPFSETFFHIGTFHLGADFIWNSMMWIIEKRKKMFYKKTKHEGPPLNIIVTGVSADCMKIYKLYCTNSYTLSCNYLKCKIRIAIKLCWFHQISSASCLQHLIH